MHTVSGKPLEGKVLGTTPGFDRNTTYTGKISDDVRIYAIILPNVVKGLLVVLNFLWIEAVNSDREWREQVVGRKIIRQVDTVETSSFHTDHNELELMVMF